MPCKTKFYQAHRDSECGKVKLNKEEELKQLRLVTMKLGHGHLLYVSYHHPPENTASIQTMFAESLKNGTARVLRHVCNGTLTHNTKITSHTFGDDFRFSLLSEARDATVYNSVLFPFEKPSPRSVELKDCRPTVDRYARLSKAFGEQYRVDSDSVHIPGHGSSPIPVKVAVCELEWMYSVPVLWVNEQKRGQIERLRKSQEVQTLQVFLSEPPLVCDTADYQSKTAEWYARWLGPKENKDREVKEFLLTEARKPRSDPDEFTAGERLAEVVRETWDKHSEDSQQALINKFGEADYEEYLNTPRVFDPSGDRYKKVLELANKLKPPTTQQISASVNLLRAMLEFESAQNAAASSSASSSSSAKANSTPPKSNKNSSDKK